MAAIVHGWCGYVEKANDVVSQQMVLNKLWIPDVLIDIIKDFMYISAAEVLRKFYRLHLNLHINDLSCSVTILQDIYGRDRIAVWRTQTGYYGDDVPDIQLQGGICVECGSCCSFHNNLTGCCLLAWDIEGEAQELIERVVEEEDTIPEVTWDVSIPAESAPLSPDALRQMVSDNWDQMVEDGFQQALEDTLRDPPLYEEYDMESQMADYAEYQKELEQEEWNGRSR